MDAERLSKFLSRSGVASRRRADEIIREGAVTVNGTVVLDPYYRVVPDRDMVLVYGRKVQAPSRFHYIALNKPKGFISDLSDPRGAYFGLPDSAPKYQKCLDSIRSGLGIRTPRTITESCLTGGVSY